MRALPCEQVSIDIEDVKGSSLVKSMSISKTPWAQNGDAVMGGIFSSGESVEGGG
jgi:hypothetical protein